jgi:hypothetical protein
MAEAAIFTCSICGEPASEICVYCTKDACGNHRCERCKRCSDCCECDVPLSVSEASAAAAAARREEPQMETPQAAVQSETEPAAEPSPEPSENVQPREPKSPIF